VMLIAQQVVASQTSPAACVNNISGDGCTLSDVMDVLLKALGLIQ